MKLVSELYVLCCTAYGPFVSGLHIPHRFLATGNSYVDLYYQFRIGMSTLSNIIPETCLAIWTALCADHLTCPRTPEEWKEVAKNFFDMWNFPMCVGALDGKHVVMRKPWNARSTYHNYKGSESVVLMALCDSKYRYAQITFSSYQS